MHATYQYQCRVCDDVYEPVLDSESIAKRNLDEGREVCHNRRCPGTYRRRFSFSSPADPIGDGYYDHSVGSFISSTRQLADVNKARSDADSIRHNREVRYTSTPIGDVPPQITPHE